VKKAKKDGGSIRSGIRSKIATETKYENVEYARATRSWWKTRYWSLQMGRELKLIMLWKRRMKKKHPNRFLMPAISLSSW